jgi:hypothetical protein
MCGVSKFLKIWIGQEVDSCPRCGNYEDANHAWICQAPFNLALWQQRLHQLERWLETRQTDPD